MQEGGKLKMEYYTFSDFVYGKYIVERTGEAVGKVRGIICYPSQRAPANRGVVREILPYENGTVKYFDFANQPKYDGEILSYEDFRVKAIEQAMTAAKRDKAVLKILRRHLNTPSPQRKTTSKTPRKRKGGMYKAAPPPKAGTVNGQLFMSSEAGCYDIR